MNQSAYFYQNMYGQACWSDSLEDFLKPIEFEGPKKAWQIM